VICAVALAQRKYSTLDINTPALRLASRDDQIQSVLSLGDDKRSGGMAETRSISGE
jgi:hypothetical protein